MRSEMLIFAYGTLSEQLIRDRVLEHSVDAHPAILHGYRKVCGWDYFTIVPGDGDVRGVVFEASPEDILRMDMWEEVPTYRLFTLPVEVGGEQVEAGCYVMPEPPENYEFVDDDRIAAIPLAEIIRDVENMVDMRRFRRSMGNVEVLIRQLPPHGREEDQGTEARRGADVQKEASGRDG